MKIEDMRFYLACSLLPNLMLRHNEKGYTDIGAISKAWSLAHQFFPSNKKVPRKEYTHWLEQKLLAMQENKEPIGTASKIGRRDRKESTQSCPNCHQIKMVPVRVVTDYECKNCGYRA